MRTLYVRDRVYNYDHCIAGGPRTGGGFLHPSDFAIGSGDTVYLLSKGIDYIPAMGITKCGLDGEFFWHERGPAFSERVGPLPSSVAVDSQENVYVSDEYTNRIGVYAPDGTHLGEWGAPQAEDRVMPGLSLNIWSMTFNPYLKKVGAIDTSGDGELNGPVGLPSIGMTGCMYRTATTTGFRYSPRTASSWTSGGATAAARESLTCLGG